jgi:hypothetical protein
MYRGLWGGLWMGFPKRVSLRSCSTPTGLRGAAIMVCQDREICDWFAGSAPTLTAWEGSKFKVVEMDALPVFKRVTAWFPGPPEDTETLFQRLCRLNRGLEPRQWWVYERKEEPNGVRLVLSIDQASVNALEERGWKAFRCMGLAVFSLLGAKPVGEEIDRASRGGGRGGGGEL